MVGKYLRSIQKYLYRYLQNPKIGSIPILPTKKLLTIIVNIYGNMLVVFKMSSKKGITYKKIQNIYLLNRQVTSNSYNI